MKAYLSDNYRNIVTNYYGSKVRQHQAQQQVNQQPFNNLNRKSNIKLTNENNKYVSQLCQSKHKSLKTESQSVSIKSNRHHTRAHTRTHTEDIPQYKTKQSKHQLKELNKTYFKKHIKSQIYQANPETKITSRTKTYEVQENNFLNMVKNRLSNESQNKKLHENAHLTKLISLAKKSKELSSKNQNIQFEDKQSIQNPKQLHILMKQEIQNFCSQMTNNPKSNANIQPIIGQLLKLMMDNIQQLSDVRQKQGRVLKVIQQLQEKNIRLMTLINHLKKKGIDVDSYWINQA